MRRAFTIIELLTVSALLSLLAGLLFPVFAQARDKGRQAVCLSNIRQLGFAFTCYADDNDGWLPGNGDYAEASRGGWVWVPQEYQVDVERGSLFGYAHSSGIFVCARVYGPLGFSMNNELGWRAAGVFPQSDTVLLLEEDARGPAGKGLNDGVFFFSRNRDLLTGRHAGGGHFIYLDGHAAWRPSDYRWRSELLHPDVSGGG